MSFDETIIHCSAPSLCGIKPASLFSMKNDCFNSGRTKLNEWRNIFSKLKRYFVPIKKNDDRMLFFVFDRFLLEKICSDEKNIEYLKSKKYPVEKGFNAILTEILHRLTFSENFPHEIGLFLGYPLEDVIGFEEDSTKYKYAGVWKVYGDKDAAKRQMILYKKCTEECMNWISNGSSVPASIKNYTNSNFNSFKRS